MNKEWSSCPSPFWLCAQQNLLAGGDREGMRIVSSFLNSTANTGSIHKKNCAAFEFYDILKKMCEIKCVFVTPPSFIIRKKHRFVYIKPLISLALMLIYCSCWTLLSCPKGNLSSWIIYNWPENCFAHRLLRFISIRACLHQIASIHTTCTWKLKGTCIFLAPTGNDPLFSSRSNTRYM